MNEQNNFEPHHEQEQNPEPNPRIWVGSLADYNAGRLHGEWLNAAVEDSDLQAAVARILAASREPVAEEWAIFDYDDFAGYRVAEYDQLEVVAAIARGIKEHGSVFGAWAEIHDGNRDMLAQFEESYLGEYADPADWARELLDSDALERALDEVIPESLRAYVQIHYDDFVEDARLSGDLHFERAPNGNTWIFRVI